MSIGFHCGSGEGARGTGFPQYIKTLKSIFPKMEVAQIFASNPKSFFHCSWTDKTCVQVRETCISNNIRLFIHAPYIINPCAWVGGGIDNPDGEKICNLVVNLLERGSTMGAIGLVIHVGKSLKLGETVGISRMVEFCREVLRRSGKKSCRLLIETCAGQGTEVARDLKTFGEFIRLLVSEFGTDTVGACIDTCHVFASGYTMDNLCKIVDDTIGLDNTYLIHLNDSQTECGARVDRHDIINHGKIGGSALGEFCKSVVEKKPDMPFILETPTTEDGSSRAIEFDWFTSLFPNEIEK